MKNYYKRTFDGAVFSEETLLKEEKFHAWLN